MLYQFQQQQQQQTRGVLSQTSPVTFAVPFPSPNQQVHQQQPGQQQQPTQQQQSVQQQQPHTPHQQPLTPSQQHLNNFQQSPRVTSVSSNHLDQPSPNMSQPPSIEGIPNGISLPAPSPTIPSTPTSSSPSNSSHHQQQSLLPTSTGGYGKGNTPNSSGQVATVSTTIKRVS